MSVDISHLPKSLQRKPHIKALALSDRVYKGDGPNHFRVAGGSDIYEVHRFGGRFICNCTAASTGRTCAHSIAAHNYCKDRKDNT